MSGQSDKGLQNGKCNRAACPNRPATCYSTVERAFYCVPCARKINEWLPPGVVPIALTPIIGSKP